MLRHKLSPLLIIVPPVILFASLLAQLSSFGTQPVVAAHPETDPYLRNENFECSNGTYQIVDSSGQTLTMPIDWNWAPITGTPQLISTRIQVTGDCDGTGFVDRLEGEDSFMIRSQDIEMPPEPGKPFDVAIYQHVTVTPGIDYGVSGFMVSFCGGSASPNDCPEGYTINKMVGLDPHGGIDPLADSVVWVENREPHITVRWANLYVASRATAPSMTVFIRLQSPFQWHGNHGIIDQFSMAAAPVVSLTDLPGTPTISGTVGMPTGTHIVRGLTQEIRWVGELSTDIEAIEGEEYALKFDVAYRKITDDIWRSLVEGHAGAGCAVFKAPTLNETYQFRVRGLAARPNTGGHRYPSLWSEPISIHFQPSPADSSVPSMEGDAQLYVPLINHPSELVCEQITE